MAFFTGFNGKVTIYEYFVTLLPHTVSNIAPLPFQPCHYFINKMRLGFDDVQTETNIHRRKDESSQPIIEVQIYRNNNSQCQKTKQRFDINIEVSTFRNCHRIINPAKETHSYGLHKICKNNANSHARKTI